MTQRFVLDSPSSQVWLNGLTTFLLICLCYAAGRIHQFYRQTTEREDAFRNGYDQATKSLFALATRLSRYTITRGGSEPPSPTPPSPMRAVVPPVPPRTRGPRHRAADRRRAELAETSRFNYGDLPDRRAS